MIIVSNTSPIWNLWIIDQLQLLEQLYETITIPNAVYDELIQGGLKTEFFQKQPWISIQSINNVSLCNMIQNKLDIGEAESICLAKEVGASALLIDEKKGRQIAIQMGLKIAGVLGILIESKEQNLVSNIKPLLDQMMLQTGFRIEKNLYIQTLVKVNEL